MLPTTPTSSRSGGQPRTRLLADTAVSHAPSYFRGCRCTTGQCVSCRCNINLHYCSRRCTCDPDRCLNTRQTIPPARQANPAIRDNWRLRATPEAPEPVEREPLATARVVESPLRVQNELQVAEQAVAAGVLPSGAVTPPEAVNEVEVELTWDYSYDTSASDLVTVEESAAVEEPNVFVELVNDPVGPRFPAVAAYQLVFLGHPDLDQEPLPPVQVQSRRTGELSAWRREFLSIDGPSTDSDDEGRVSSTPNYPITNRWTSFWTAGSAVQQGGTLLVDSSSTDRLDSTHHPSS